MPETLTLVISGYQFTLLAPYEQGQPLGAAEAALLNKEWAQAIRISFAPRVADALAVHDEKLPSAEVQILQDLLRAHAAAFAFKALASPRSTDALTRQKHAIARRVLDMKLNSEGMTREAWGEHKYESALSRLMNHHEIIRQATEQLASTRDAADILAGMAP